MCRVCCLGVRLLYLVVAIAATDGMADDHTRDTFWVGSHRCDVQQCAGTVADVLALHLTWTYSDPTQEQEINEQLRRYFEQHSVEVDDEIGLHLEDLRSHYDTESKSALAVISGAGFGPHENMESLLYIGPKTEAFRIHVAKLRLLDWSIFPENEMLAKLLFLYAMIKEAYRNKLNFQTYVGPLRAFAFSVLTQAKSANPRIVEMIEKDLEGISSSYLTIDEGNRS